MKALLISDQDYHTGTFINLQKILYDLLKEKGFEIEEVEVGEKNLVFCKGCFGCWVKKPGECVINDLAAHLNNIFINSDVVFYISPVVFGQFSANIKNALDRSLPNILPFFVKRADGSTSHPPRYKSYPKQIIIGCADEIEAADQQLFIDITTKHRRNVETLIYKGLADNDRIISAINHFNLSRVEGIL